MTVLIIYIRGWQYKELGVSPQRAWSQPTKMYSGVYSVNRARLLREQSMASQLSNPLHVLLTAHQSPLAATAIPTLSMQMDVLSPPCRFCLLVPQ